MKPSFTLSIALLASACAIEDDPTILVTDPLLEMVDGSCPELFHQDVFPAYRIEISNEHRLALQDEFENRMMRESMGLATHPYHPIVFEYDGERVQDAMIRLKGQSSWWQALAFDEHPKMQFVISFNEVDPTGRFHGVRKIELDMPRTDASFLRQRLALYYMRRAGVPAQCANNAGLTINGEFYGLYTNLERLNKDFLERVYAEFDGGDLWEGARSLETNEETASHERMAQLWAATTIDDLEALVDMDASLEVWAAEAMTPHGDGYYNGRANFFIYDHPTRGFTWLPHDLDSAFDFLPPDASPLFPSTEGGHPNDRQHWAIVMSDPRWQDMFVERLEQVRSMYDAAILESNVMRWGQQLADAADADPMKPFSTSQHEFAVQALLEYPSQRIEVVDSWLSCRRGEDLTDEDGDGYTSCFDCNDLDDAVHPGAIEVCNEVDDNCDGLIDEVVGGERC